jgi:hypothetical protein
MIKMPDMKSEEYKCNRHTVSDDIPSIQSPHANMHKRKTEKQSLFPHVLDAATRFAALKVQKSNRKMSEMKTGNINGKMKTGVMPRMTSHQYRHQTQKFPHRKPKNSAYFRTLFVRSRRLGAQKVQKQISKKCRK